MAALWDSFLEAPDYINGSPWFPNPAVCIRDMAITGTRETMNRLPWNGLGAWLNETWYWVSRASYNDPAAVLMPVLLATVMTVLRVFLNWALFRVSATEIKGVWLSLFLCSVFPSGVSSLLKPRISFQRASGSHCTILSLGYGAFIWCGGQR
jgi:hypothetical protein